MKLYNVNFNAKISIKAVVSIYLVSSLFYYNSYANEHDAEEMQKVCERQAVFTVIELKTKSEEKYTEREIEMLHLGVATACMGTYHRLANENSIVSDKKSIAGKSEQDAVDDSKASWLDRLLDVQAEEPVNPMVKKHRTGGK